MFPKSDTRHRLIHNHGCLYYVKRTTVQQLCRRTGRQSQVDAVYIHNGTHSTVVVLIGLGKQELFNAIPLPRFNPLMMMSMDSRLHIICSHVCLYCLNWIVQQYTLYRRTQMITVECSAHSPRYSTVVLCPLVRVAAAGRGSGRLAARRTDRCHTSRRESQALKKRRRKLRFQHLGATRRAAGSAQPRKGYNSVGKAGWGAQRKQGRLARVEERLLHNHLLSSREISRFSFSPFLKLRMRALIRASRVLLSEVILMT